ncbi:hypothetical protein ABIA39_004555 [Nocardia sp. GAS34]
MDDEYTWRRADAADIRGDGRVRLRHAPRPLRGHIR